MSQTTEGASENVELVRFSFMTDEEVRKHSIVKLTNPILLDSVERPVPGGLYDPALGPLDDEPCKSCGQRSFYCPGHCGHIDLVSPAYNPLLFDMLYNLLQRTCFFCLHFRESRIQVEKCTSQLEMIARGDIIGAKRLDAEIESVYSEDSYGSHVPCSTVHSGAQNYSPEHQKLQAWTSLQFSEAKSVLNKFLKRKLVKCKKCNATNPKISKPTFGWLHMMGMSDAHTRANIIRGCKLQGAENGGEDKSSSEVVNVNECAWENDLDTAETTALISTSDGIEDSVIKRNVKKKQGNVKKKQGNLKKTRRVSKEFSKQKHLFSGPLLPSEVRDIVKHLWENEAELCSFMCNIQPERLNASGKIAGHSMFFLQAILVPPIKFRPASKGADSVMEHAHTVLLGKVLQSNIALGNAHVNNSERSKIVNRWMDLQQSLNVLFDSKNAMGQGQRDGASGICQLLEKKEGVFRQNMMGKRVNFACRSVISPDPYLAVNEIGIPPYFALRLTYPERVTPWNVVKLRDAIINGPEIHPGATNYADKMSNVKLPPSKKTRISISRKLPSSRGVVTEPGKNYDYEFEGKTVYRHLQDGDIVLVNRQPTLHKPSIMAHVVRVLKGEKTLRMHYANCNSYNADFDGDEMNVHLPQDEVSRAEAYNIVNANNQYIVPTRGDTVRGLIQDHIVSAVLLTMKNTFLTRDEFNQLLYGSGVFTLGPSSLTGNPSQKISVVDSEGLVHSVLPAVWKPKPLWTGKQVITAVLNHLTRGCTPFTVENEGKIPYGYFAGVTGKSEPNKDEKDHVENKLLIWKNELVHGVIDKAQFGKYGLVHTVQELYGSNCAGILLSTLSRLFTVFLQIHGFTCGVDDLIVLPHYDIRRKEELEGEDVGESVHCDFVQFKSGEIGPIELQMEIEKAICSNGQSAIARLDTKMKNKLREKGSQINQELLRKGLLKPFPNNCISLMTISGAKGSTVNFQQISSSLGQQELEGKRVPRMASGKTLPCFSPWDFASRAGGFITDRFLTGLRPQEYYFHCMAGREGLVDTAVKTSRSGYLQRCLIKNLECLKVCYDYTVRDADGSIIQFYYGEDGVDVHQTSFLNKFKALAENQEIICQKFHHQLEFNSYIKELPKGLREKGEKFINNLLVEEEDSLKQEKKEDFFMLMKQKYLSSLAQSGEPVGVIAAQSVGEPSTQMTLNTFHLAGRGEMNVTLGIPRLQEILMTASENIKTPIMTCPLLRGKSKDDACALVAKVKKVTVADLIESIEVRVLPLSIHNHQISRIYKLIVKLKQHEHVSLEDSEETLKCKFLRELEDSIQNHLNLLSKISGIKNFMPKSKSKGSDETGEDSSSSRSREGEKNDDDDDDDDDDGSDEDIDYDVQKRKRQNTDEMEYEGGSADELSEEEPPDELAKETDQAADEVEIMEEGEIGDFDVQDEASKMTDEDGTISNPESSDREAKSNAKIKERVKATPLQKDTDKVIFWEAKGLCLEAHFCFGDEPHILLAQIAQKAAKKVYFGSSGKIDHCQIVEYDVNERQVLWEEKKLEEKPDKEDGKKPWGALKAAGVDFTSFWEMEDVLEIRKVYTNNIHVILKTFGVEAARKAIINEVTTVFKIYGVEVDFRHLSLIADYMTHSGGYRPMSRHGSIAESISPFMKISFETASKFIVEAATHGMTDNLETPSARICLGLPVKVGTGCFDLMQKLEI